MSDHIWSGYEVVELGTIESDLIISAHMDHSHVQVYMLAFPSHRGIDMTSTSAIFLLWRKAEISTLENALL